MRLTDYSFVFADWQPDGFTLLNAGYNFAVHLGLPYIEFQAATDQGLVTVRCDPCSLDQDRVAYAAMVRADLEQAIAKRMRSGPPESDTPSRLTRHLQDCKPGMSQDAGNLTLYFHDDAKDLRAFWLAHEVMGGKASEQSPDGTPNPAAMMADSVARLGRTEMSSGNTCMQSK